ncbi:hypothetical protein, partial [Mycobacterium tuberculosis]
KKPLWMGCNDKRRISVKCTYPCNFAIWFGRDQMLGKTDWCVKTVHKSHNGYPDKKLLLFNSTFLASAMEGKFRVLPDMTLAAI